MGESKENKQLLEYFKDKVLFTKEELSNYYKQTTPDLKDTTLRWRIYNLKKENVIRSVGRGVYTISVKPVYKPEPNDYVTKINRAYLAQYDEVNYCIWQSDWLYKFMIHQPFSYFYVLEVEKDVSKDVFFYLKDEGFKVFYQPDESMIDDYVADTRNAIIIKPITTKSPLYTKRKVKLASIEKILVDVFCDKNIYPVFNDSELINIFENLIDNYIIDFSKMLNYARRRNRHSEMRNFINNNFDNLVKNII